MVIIVRVLGLAAFVAAARAAWLHHCDNQLVIRTDLMRESFAAGQAAERNRAAEEAETARRAAYLFPDVKAGSQPPCTVRFQWTPDDGFTPDSSGGDSFGDDGWWQG